jgi:hypothetical protein
VVKGCGMAFFEVELASLTTRCLDLGGIVRKTLESPKIRQGSKEASAEISMCSMVWLDKTRKVRFRHHSDKFHRAENPG